MPFRPRLSIRTLMIVVAVLAVILGISQYWLRVNASRAIVFTAICHSRDWQKITAKMKSGTCGEFSTYVFHAQKPAEIFADFKTSPLVSKVWDVNSQMSGHLTRRDFDSPIEGRFVKTPHESVHDVVMMSGTVQHSFGVPRRYTIHLECFLDSRFHSDASKSILAPAIPDQAKLFEPSSHVLVYSGVPSGNLVVFARPVGDDLVQLLVVQLN
jgi:hypothetical protein